MSIYYDKILQMKGNFQLNYSPNFSPKKRKSKNIKFIILHYTGMISENKAINRLTDVNSKVSCHYFIKKSGKIVKMVPEKYIAWHAGVSNWKKFRSLNNMSLGIEIHNKGHEYGYTKFQNVQIKKTILLLKYLQEKYKIKKNNILGHSDISYNRKKDPGEKFPWDRLAKNNLVIWHNIPKKKLRKLRKKKISNSKKISFFKSLKKIGYLVNQNNKDKLNLIVAFQRKYRASVINGIIDEECYYISKILSKC